MTQPACSFSDSVIRPVHTDAIHADRMAGRFWSCDNEIRDFLCTIWTRSFDVDQRSTRSPFESWFHVDLSLLKEVWLLYLILCSLSGLTFTFYMQPLEAMVSIFLVLATVSFILLKEVLNRLREDIIDPLREIIWMITMNTFLNTHSLFIYFSVKLTYSTFAWFTIF